jgi:hypothetical protein
MRFLLNGLCWELSMECLQISSTFYGFRDKLDRKRPKSAIFQKFESFTFSLNFNAVFCEEFILIGY